MHPSDIRKGLFLTAAGAIGWGVSGVCGQYLFMYYHLDAAWLTAMRMVLSGVVLLALVIRTDKMRPFRIWCNAKDVGKLLAFALVGLLMCQYTFLAAIKYGNSATATVLQSLNVVIMMLVLALWHRTRPSGIQLTSVGLALAGTVLIATKGDLSTMALSPLGLSMGILAAVGVVTYTLLSRGIVEKWGNLTVTGWGMLVGGGVLFVLTRAWHFPPNLDAMAWLMIGIVVIIGTAVGFSAFLEGVKLIGPMKGTLIGCLEPVSATILAALFLGTRFHVMELVGFACIMLTIVLSVVDKK